MDKNSKGQSSQQSDSKSKQKSSTDGNSKETNPNNPTAKSSIEKSSHNDA